MKRSVIASLLGAAAIVSFSHRSAAADAPSKPATGDNGTTSSDYPEPNEWPDLHDWNRAVAFGSLILANGGSNIDNWKEVNPYGYCFDAEGGIIIKNPAPKASGDGDNTGSGSGSSSGDPTDPVPVPECGWSVMVTTAYQFVECPDGRAYIERSGEGVSLIDRHTGETFAWGEAVACGDGPFFAPSQQNNGRDAHRPLDLLHLKVTRR